MADPIVHITSGVPDSGTGNITTLGLTIQAQSTATSGQSGPLVQGAVTTGAPGQPCQEEAPAATDADWEEGGFAHPVNTVEPIGQVRDRSIERRADGHALRIDRFV